MACATYKTVTPSLSHILKASLQGPTSGIGSQCAYQQVLVVRGSHDIGQVNKEADIQSRQRIYVQPHTIHQMYLDVFDVL